MPIRIEYGKKNSDGELDVFKSALVDQPGRTRGDGIFPGEVTSTGLGINHVVIGERDATLDLTLNVIPEFEVSSPEGTTTISLDRQGGVGRGATLKLTGRQWVQFDARTSHALDPTARIRRTTRVRLVDPD